MPRPYFSVLSLPFWQDRKEGHPAPTKARMKIQGILSKHEVTAIARKIYRLAPTVNPPLDGGPAVLHIARGILKGEPLESLFAFFLSTQKEGPRRPGGRRDNSKITEKPGKDRAPKRKPITPPSIFFTPRSHFFTISLGILHNFVLQYGKGQKIFLSPV